MPTLPDVFTTAHRRHMHVYAFSRLCKSHGVETGRPEDFFGLAGTLTANEGFRAGFVRLTASMQRGAEGLSEAELVAVVALALSGLGALEGGELKVPDSLFDLITGRPGSGRAAEEKPAKPAGTEEAAPAGVATEALQDAGDDAKGEGIEPAEIEDVGAGEAVRPPHEERMPPEYSARLEQLEATRVTVERRLAELERRVGPAVDYPPELERRTEPERRAPAEAVEDGAPAAAVQATGLDLTPREAPAVAAAPLHAESGQAESRDFAADAFPEEEIVPDDAGAAAAEKAVWSLPAVAAPSAAVAVPSAAIAVPSAAIAATDERVRAAALPVRVGSEPERVVRRPRWSLLVPAALLVLALSGFGLYSAGLLPAGLRGSPGPRVPLAPIVAAPPQAQAKPAPGTPLQGAGSAAQPNTPAAPAGLKPDSPAAAQEAVAQVILGWEVAARNNNVAGELTFYAPRLDRYFLQRGVTKEYVRRDKQSFHDNGHLVRSFDVDNVVIQFPSRDQAVVSLRKTYSIAVPSQAPANLQITQSRLWMRRTVDGWKITGEQDLSAGG